MVGGRLQLWPSLKTAWTSLETHQFLNKNRKYWDCFWKVGVASLLMHSIQLYREGLSGKNKEVAEGVEEGALMPFRYWVKFQLMWNSAQQITNKLDKCRHVIVTRGTICSLMPPCPHKFITTFTCNHCKQNKRAKTASWKTSIIYSLTQMVARSLVAMYGGRQFWKAGCKT